MFIYLHIETKKTYQNEDVGSFIGPMYDIFHYFLNVKCLVKLNPIMCLFSDYVMLHIE